MKIKLKSLKQARMPPDKPSASFSSRITIYFFFKSNDFTKWALNNTFIHLKIADL